MPYDIKAAVSKVGVEQKNFSVFVGAAKSQVLITSAAPSTKQIEEAHKLVGNTKAAALKGVCFRELTGKLIFGVKGEPPPPAKAAITAGMKVAGCTKWEIKPLKDGEADGVDGEASESEDDEAPQPKVAQSRAPIGQRSPAQGNVAPQPVNPVQGRVQPAPGQNLRGPVMPGLNRPQPAPGQNVQGRPVPAPGQGNAQMPVNPMQGRVAPGQGGARGPVNPAQGRVAPAPGQGNAQTPVNPMQGRVAPGEGGARGPVNPAQGRVAPAPGQGNPQTPVNPMQGRVAPGEGGARGPVNPAQGRVAPAPGQGNPQTPVNPMQGRVAPGEGGARGPVNPAQGRVAPAPGQGNPQTPVNPMQGRVAPGEGGARGPVNPAQGRVAPAPGQGNPQTPVNPMQGRVAPGEGGARGPVNPAQGRVAPAPGQGNPQTPVNPMQGRVAPGEGGARGPVNPAQGRVAPAPGQGNPQTPVNPMQGRVAPGQGGARGPVNPAQGRVAPAPGQGNPQTPVNPMQGRVAPGQGGARGPVNPAQGRVAPGQGNAQGAVNPTQARPQPGQPQRNPQGAVNPVQGEAQPGQAQTQPQAQPPKPKPAVALDPAKGKANISVRAAAAVQEAQTIASAVPQDAFKDKSAVAQSSKKVSVKAVAVGRKELEQSNQVLIDGTSGKAQQQHEAASKAVVAAMKKADGFRSKAKDLDALETAHKDALKVYQKQFNADLYNLDSELGMHLAEKNDVEAKKAQAKIDNYYKSPAATAIARSADAMLHTQLRKNVKVAADLKKAVKAAKKAQSEENLAKVRDLAAQYRKVFEDHGAVYKSMPGQEPPAEIRDQIKAVDDVLDQADLMLFSAKQKRLGNPPWPKDKEAEGAELFDKGREIAAKNAFRTGDVKRPSGGTSEVLVLKEKGPNGKVQFAFKSARGETSQMGLPPGGGAVREAVSSKVADAVMAQTGFDFGIPKATVATIEGSTGALIEGVNGTEVPAADTMLPADRSKWAKFQNKLPAKEIQKAAMAGLITGNFLDLKWDNVFWEGEGDNAKARPFDAGASFLPTEAISYQMWGRVGNEGFGEGLLFDAEKNPVKGATEPMDDEIMQAMLAIDVNAMKATIEEEVKRHAATGLDQCMDKESRENGLKCLELSQKVLKAHKDNPPTLQVFIAELKKELIAAYPKPPPVAKPAAKPK